MVTLRAEDQTRVVLITGATRGIGLATAAEFVKNGDRVVIGCRHQKHVRQALSRLRNWGTPENLLGLAGDVRKSAAVQGIVHHALLKFGRIDILINNAGMAVWKPVEETEEKEWDEVLDTNLKGPFLFTRQVVPIMKAQGKGIIINVSSELGVVGQAGFAAYSASKFGLVGLTQVVAEELQDSPLRVYAVLPGGVATKLHLDIHPWEDPAGLMTPQYVARKIFRLAQGKKRSGTLLRVSR
jgi:NAD(P)-dependent dehydrogenase (short-subunit alcohol dehydrogenase family)